MGFREIHVYTDVLIIGGGSAGAMAAIRAKEVDPSQRVTVFEKGDILYSGCIARGMDALNIAHPATFVIDRQGTIRLIYVGMDQHDRMPAQAIIETLRAIRKEAG